ncbi:cytochrome c551/c552 [Sphingomonas zeicaulis]|uniref:c-type cytochrome n=1 Tax=Sphingomonas zeicaulis TaxID=1632740 RepID=UPI003D20A360
MKSSPASLRFVLILLGLGFLGAAASIIVQYRAGERRAQHAAEAMTGGSAERGKVAIERLGCGACHIIPGIDRANGRVGPSLRALASRAMIAGRLPNRPALLIAWVRAPEHVSPDTAMPDQRVSDSAAHDIAAYLYTLR